MANLNKIYSGLCAVSVFSEVLKSNLFCRFFDYCHGKTIDEKMISYSKFVGEIYKNGGDLTDMVRKAVFEDENVYIKNAAKGTNVNGHIADAVNYELGILSEFASITTDDFHRDFHGIDYIPAFDSKEIDLKKEYAMRVANIKKCGYGIFSSHGMFRIADDGAIIPIMSPDKTTMDSFVGYKEERQRILANTEMLLSGRPAANALLYGDAGTGKSSTVKAITNHFFSEGLRLIEVRKNQLLYLPKIMGEISENPLKFIIFIDDLSFNTNDDNFSMLKATLEGSASAKADNAVIYATSNRRHIIKESFGEREGSDVHRNDTVQETLSLSERFGLRVLFAKPEKRLYLEIVKELARRKGLDIPPAELEVKAEAFVLRHGYRSARCAEQFIDSLM